MTNNIPAPIKMREKRRKALQRKSHIMATRPAKTRSYIWFGLLGLMAIILIATALLTWPAHAAIKQSPTIQEQQMDTTDQDHIQDPDTDTRGLTPMQRSRAKYAKTHKRIDLKVINDPEAIAEVKRAVNHINNRYQRIKDAK